jgi:hypothetical protein
MNLRRALPFVVLGLALAVPATPQERLEYELPPGTRVRLTVEGSQVEGYLSGRQGNSVRLALLDHNPFAPEMTVPLSAATRVEVHVGRKRHTKVGALVGAVVMGLTGIWGPVDSSPECYQASSAPCSRGESIAISAMAGAALGALAGYALTTDQWAPVPPEALGVAPPTPEEIREAPGGPGVPAGRSSPARVNVRF